MARIIAVDVGIRHVASLTTEVLEVLQNEQRSAPLRGPRTARQCSKRGKDVRKVIDLASRAELKRIDRSYLPASVAGEASNDQTHARRTAAAGGAISRSKSAKE